MLCSQGHMFNGASSFDQPSLYCDWNAKTTMELKIYDNFCEGPISCGMNNTCPTAAPTSTPTATPTSTPTATPTASPTTNTTSTGNGGGGKAAAICFLNCHYGALLILLNYYIIFNTH
jgi:hypothetical protein